MSNYKLEWHGDDARKAAWEAGKQGLHLGAEAICTEAKKICPHDKGILEDSITVVPGVSNDHEHTEHVIADTPYAIRQHEIPYRHENGRQWKYIEKPANDLAPKVGELIYQKMKSATK